MENIRKMVYWLLKLFTKKRENRAIIQMCNFLIFYQKLYGCFFLIEMSNSNKNKIESKVDYSQRIMMDAFSFAPSRNSRYSAKTIVMKCYY